MSTSLQRVHSLGFTHRQLVLLAVHGNARGFPMRPVDILLKLKEMGFPVSRSIVSARLSELKKEGLVADVSNLGPAPRYEATNKGVEYLTKLTALLDDEELGEFSE